ncbi:MAG: FtsQ-type POTRA domain-containing protein [Patescibacteria group bacterium]|nr:FtsQ-type POTRA domain-containing protein [Patescibacteria group bacterium]
MQLRNPKVYNPSYAVEKKKFSKVYIYIILILIVLGGLIYFLFYSSFFKIKNIVIENSNNSEISKIFQELNGANIFRFNSSKTQAEITQKFPEVKGAKITRGLPDTLKIQFSEVSAKVIWQTGQKNFLVDGNGEIYKEIQLSDVSQNNLPIIKDNNNVSVNLGQKILSGNFLDFVTELNTTFNQETGFKINQFEINETLFQVDALTDQSWKVIFDTTRSVPDQLADLKKFLADHKNEVTQYIDVRIEGRVYYK